MCIHIYHQSQTLKTLKSNRVPYFVSFCSSALLFICVLLLFTGMTGLYIETGSTSSSPDKNSSEFGEGEPISLRAGIDGSTYQGKQAWSGRQNIDDAGLCVSQGLLIGVIPEEPLKHDDIQWHIQKQSTSQYYLNFITTFLWLQASPQQGVKRCSLVASFNFLSTEKMLNFLKE